MPDKKINELPEATTLTVTDLLVLINDSQTRKATIATFLSFINGQAQFANLDVNGKVPVSQIPASLIGASTYQSAWNANTNSPTIPTAATGNKGWYYVVSTAGTTTINSINDWKVGDWIISNGTAWEKVDNTDALTSWNSRVGAVTPQSGDYTTDQVTEGSTNKFYTAVRVLTEVLTGLNVQNAAIVATDSILTALGKTQGQINAKESSANKGAASGYASLDTNGLIPLAQIPASLIGAVTYQSSWNANTNTPPLSTATTSNKGWYYVVSTSGTTTVSGISEWKTGDWIISNGTSWEKVDNTDALLSWNGRIGAIVPQSGDYTTDQVTEGSTNKFYTASRVLAEVLAGLNVQNAAIVASDSILIALGKAQGQIATKENSSNKGIASGYASLDSSILHLRAEARAELKYNTVDINSVTAPSGTAESIIFSRQIPANVLAAGDVLTIGSWVGATSNANTKTWRIYINTSNSLSGATLIATLAVTTNSAATAFNRNNNLVSNTSILNGVAGNVSSAGGAGTTVLDPGITVPSISAGFWVIFSAQKAVSADVMRLDRVLISQIVG